MPINQSFTSEVNNDIKGLWHYEIMTEKKMKESLDKMMREWKMSEQEVRGYYKTNFKKLFATTDIKSENIFRERIAQINSVTNKVIALYLSKQQQQVEEPTYLRSMIYSGTGINKDIAKNSTSKNIMKWVIDELMSIPEMVAIIFADPRWFLKWIKSALIDNFQKTMEAITKQYTDILWWVWTPDKAYKTWRSGVLIVMTCFPWAIGKTLLNTGKWILRLTKRVVPNAAKNVAKNAVKTVTRSVRKNVLTKPTKVVARETRKIVWAKPIEKVSSISVKMTNSMFSKYDKLFKFDELIKAKYKKLLPKALLTKTNDVLKISDELKSVLAEYNRLKKYLTDPAYSKSWLGRTANAIKYPTLKHSPRITEISDKFKNLEGVVKSLQHSQSVLIQEITSGLVVAWLIATNNITKVTPEMIVDISKYLNESNEKTVSKVTWENNLQTWSSDIWGLEIPGLDSLPPSEITKIKLNIIWMASNIGSTSFDNNGLALRRAQKTKEVLMKKYPLLNPANISISAKVQPNDSTEDPKLRQWVQVSTNINDLAYVQWYSELVNQHNQQWT